MALRRSWVRIPLGPLFSNSFLSKFMFFTSSYFVGRSSKPSVSESGSPGVSPARCLQSTHSQAELARQPQIIGANIDGERQGGK